MGFYSYITVAFMVFCGFFELQLAFSHTLLGTARIFGPAGRPVTLGCGDQRDGAPVPADPADRADRDPGGDSADPEHVPDLLKKEWRGTCSRQEPRLFTTDFREVKRGIEA